MVDIFDHTTKLRFRSQDEPVYIKFGTMRDKDLSLDIRSGQMKLSGYASPLRTQYLLTCPFLQLRRRWFL